ncbi:hypothetical protein CPB86DRAFT_177383 [Serendipita vermifera]|nr:hypothetical protein CPB86DRAFT_177383 [Serendipita vermifera]
MSLDFIRVTMSLQSTSMAFMGSLEDDANLTKLMDDFIHAFRLQRSLKERLNDSLWMKEREVKEQEEKAKLSWERAQANTHAFCESINDFKDRMLQAQTGDVKSAKELISLPHMTPETKPMSPMIVEAPRGRRSRRSSIISTRNKFDFQLGKPTTSASRELSILDGAVKSGPSQVNGCIIPMPPIKFDDNVTVAGSTDVPSLSPSGKPNHGKKKKKGKKGSLLPSPDQPISATTTLEEDTHLTKLMEDFVHTSQHQLCLKHQIEDTLLTKERVIKEEEEKAKSLWMETRVQTYAFQRSAELFRAKIERVESELDYAEELIEDT